jgi:P27 family predicted phage terminase small subunit
MPEVAAEMPSPPEWLGEIGQAKWREKVPLLHPLGLLTKNDHDHLSLYCEAWDDLFSSLKEIETEGATCSSDKGGLYQHPAVGRKNKAIQRIRQLGSDFGMNPAARVGLTINPGSKPSGLAAFKAAK